jgi:hypothetical protein
LSDTFAFPYCSHVCNFLCISDTNKILKKELKIESIKEGRWASILGTHVLKMLAVYDQMKIDSGYCELSTECPCGCKTPINIGDNSMGNDSCLQVLKNL